MPYKSLAQERYFHAHKKELERQGVTVEEWDSASKGLKLPLHAEKVITHQRFTGKHHKK